MSEIEFCAEFAEINDIEIPEDVTWAELSIFVDDDCLTRNHARQGSRLLQQYNTSESVNGPVAGIAEWLIENWMPIFWETHTPFKKSRLVAVDGDRAALPGLREAVQEWSGFLQDDEGTSSDDSSVERALEQLIGRFPESSRDRELIEFSDWQRRHTLGHGSSNLAIPSIVILPEGRNVVLSIDRLPGDLDSSVKFVGPDRNVRRPTVFILGKIAFKEAAKSFVDRTIERAHSDEASREWAKWLAERWETAQANESDPTRQREWLLGEVATKRLEEIPLKQRIVARSLEQLLLDCPIVQQISDLDRVENRIRSLVMNGSSGSFDKEVAGWEQVAQASIPANQPDFEQGYRLARMVRRNIGLPARPIGDVKSLLGRLDVTLDDPLDTYLFRAAVCAPRNKVAHIIPSAIAPRMDREPAARFAVISALGRLLWESKIAGNTPICAAQGDYSMFNESRRANAFAAEFLLPTEAIRGVRPDSNALREMAEEYGISQSAAEWHAVNAEAR
jgi:hypothetical protein